MSPITEDETRSSSSSSSGGPPEGGGGGGVEPVLEPQGEHDVTGIQPCLNGSKLLDGEEKTYTQDPETRDKKLPYPKSVFFIIGNELCERFSYYGMKTILILYLKYQLMFNEGDATVIYHVWAMMCYFTPLLGAIIADTFLGRFRTIFYISIIYVFGNAVLSFSAITPIFPDLGPKIGVAMTGLFLIALGTGGIKPCVSAFGGDQFALPQQEKQLTQFFSIFYFSINTGSLISTYTTPLLRDDVQCYGGDCYALAFGVPAILMICALGIFVLGYFLKLYTIVPPRGSVITDVFRVVGHALKKKRKSPEKREHWLDHADDRFSRDLIADVKVLLKVLLMYIPLPVFWALFDQQGSRWTFQATRMNGDIGSFTIKPDQMQVINPLFILLMIPVFDTFIYPLLAKCNLLKRQLPRMFVGGVLAGVAFVVSGFLELQLETKYPVPVGMGESRLTFINTLPCNVTLSPMWEEDSVTLMNLEQQVYKSVPLEGMNALLSANITFPTGLCTGIELGTNPQVFYANESHAYTALITSTQSGIASIVNIDPPDEYEKSSEGMPRLRMLYDLDPSIAFNTSVLLKNSVDTYTYSIYDKAQGRTSGTEFQVLEDGTYQAFMMSPEGVQEDDPFGELTVKLGGVYNFLVHKDKDTKNYVTTLYKITEENSIHMLWLIPQYFILTVSEVMFSITGLEFSFSQAPASMKSVLQAAWLLTTAFGNLIVVIIAEAKFVDRQAMEFFLFAGLMFVDMIIFAALAYNYKYVDQVKDASNQENRKLGNKDDRKSSHVSGIDNKSFKDGETKF